jgi:hypothetical protein
MGGNTSDSEVTVEERHWHVCCGQFFLRLMHAFPSEPSHCWFGMALATSMMR